MNGIDECIMPGYVLARPGQYPRPVIYLQPFIYYDDFFKQRPI